MFRSPLDMSSDSELEEDVEKTESNEEIGSVEVVERQATNTQSLPSHGEYSASANESHEIGASQPNFSNHHANFLLATLLEDYSRVRAAEVMNASTPGAAFTRRSPEVVGLAKQLYADHGRMLEEHSVLPALYTHPEAERSRSQYLNYVDSTSLDSLQGSKTADVQHLTSLLRTDMTALALTPALSLPTPSPYQDLMLSTRFTPQLGRYHTDFRQVRLLGQGGYGRVFHCVNAVDLRHYAIKRIPLSAKVYARWSQGDSESVRTFHEIRTLARLEHPNVVRYYGAWIENPPVAQQRDSLQAPRRGRITQNLLTQRPELAEVSNYPTSPRISLGQSDGIVFGEDTEPDDANLKIVEGSVQHLIAEMPSRDHQTISAYSMRDSEVFSDGRSRSVGPIDTMNENTPVLCVQIGLHPMTLATYLTRVSNNSNQPLVTPSLRHCFHLLPSLRLLLGIICGLQYLHTLGIVHRDIKPGNILLSESVSQHAVGFYDVVSCYNCPDRDVYYLNPRIADFGLVAEIERSTQIEALQAYKATGTEFYRPPISSVESVNEKLDVFALGVLFFELLWHFGTKTERAMVLGGLQRGEVPASFAARMDVDSGHGVGQRVLQCIRGMIHKSPGQRWTLDMTKSWAEGLIEELQRSMPSAREHDGI